MAKLSLALTSALAASAAAFAPSNAGGRQSTTSLNAEGIWDPMGFYNLEESADTFPNMFPKPQFLEEAEIKHGRQAMLGWTGIWATHQVRSTLRYYLCLCHLFENKTTLSFLNSTIVD